MAIYHCTFKMIKRSEGKSVVAATAYRASEKMENVYDGIIHDYTRKTIGFHSRISAERTGRRADQFGGRSPRYVSRENFSPPEGERQRGLPHELIRAAAPHMFSRDFCCEN